MTIAAGSQNPITEMEEKFGLTVEPLHTESVDDIQSFIQKIEKAFNLTLGHQNSDEMVIPFNSDRLSFREVLNSYENDEALIIHAYIYFTIAFRKYHAYSIPESKIGLRFKLKDLLDYGEITPKMFQTLEEVPDDIFPRVLGVDDATKEQIEIEKLYKQVQSLFRQISNLESQLTTLDDSEKQDKAVKEIWKRKGKIKDILDDRVKEIISYYKTVKKVPTPQQLASFLNHFLNFAIIYPKDDFDRLKLVDNSNIISKSQYIHSESLNNLYVFSENQNTWQKLSALDKTLISRLSSNINANDKTKTGNFIKALQENIKNDRNVSAFTLRLDAIHVSNGSILYEINDDGTLDYEFISIDDMTKHDKMFRYATDSRLITVYEPNARNVFDDNRFNEPVTPAYIFEHLTKRGYTPTDDMSDEEQNNMKTEAKKRLNTLLQFTLTTIHQFGSEKPQAVKDAFLYFYGGANSGKSTFMDLMRNMYQSPNRDTDEDDINLRTPVTNLSIRDLSGDEAFGAINLKDKRIAFVDEAYDGDARKKIEMELLKKVSSHQTIGANKKNAGYQSFISKASVILASNYRPVFVDESGGTERRIVAFDLSQPPMMDEGRVDLSFIKTHLINSNEFQSACIRYLLDLVNFEQDKAPSVIDEARQIVSREDDVQDFINKIRRSIQRPVVINQKELYDMYCHYNKIVSGTNRSRNSSNFKRAVEKIGGGVRLDKFTFAKTQAYNHAIYLYGSLFSGLYRDSNNPRDFEAVIRSFHMIVDERNLNLKTVHHNIHLLASGDKKMYKTTIDKSNAKAFVIVPDDDIYGHTNLNKIDFSKFVADIRNKFYEEATKGHIMNDVTAKHNGVFTKLPTFISDSVPTSFNDYTFSTKELEERTKFTEFINQ